MEQEEEYMLTPQGFFGKEIYLRLRSYMKLAKVNAIVMDDDGQLDFEVVEKMPATDTPRGKA